MRTILALLLVGLCLTTRAQMNFANTNTGAIVASLPNVIYKPDMVIWSPTTNMLIEAGWRIVNSVAAATIGSVVDSYTIKDLGGGKCDLLVKTQHNIQAANDASMTNSPAWTLNFVTNCQMFRATLRAFGTTETQAVVNADTMSTWLAAYAKTNTITPQLTAQFIFMGQMYPQLLQYSRTTAEFPWRLIP